MRFLDIHGEAHPECRGHGAAWSSSANDLPGIRMPAHLLKGRAGQTLTGLKVALPSSLSQISSRIFLRTGALRPAAVSTSLSVVTRFRREPGAHPP